MKTHSAARTLRPGKSKIMKFTLIELLVIMQIAVTAGFVLNPVPVENLLFMMPSIRCFPLR